MDAVADRRGARSLKRRTWVMVNNLHSRQSARKGFSSDSQSSRLLASSKVCHEGKQKCVSAPRPQQRQAVAAAARLAKAAGKTHASQVQRHNPSFVSARRSRQTGRVATEGASRRERLHAVSEQMAPTSRSSRNSTPQKSSCRRKSVVSRRVEKPPTPRQATEAPPTHRQRERLRVASATTQLSASFRLPSFASSLPGSSRCKTGRAPVECDSRWRRSRDPKRIRFKALSKRGLRQQTRIQIRSALGKDRPCAPLLQLRVESLMSSTNRL